MVSSKTGIAYEHELANDVYQRSDHQLLPQRDGYSGNGSVPGPDVLIDDGEKVHAFELKRTSDDTSQTFTNQPDATEPGDIDELVQFAEEYPRNVCCYVGVRFDQRQLILANVWHSNENTLQHIVETCPVDAKVTRTDNVSIRKPPTESQATQDEDGWPSAGKGDDVDYLLEKIGYTKGVHSSE